MSASGSDERPSNHDQNGDRNRDRNSDQNRERNTGALREGWHDRPATTRFDPERTDYDLAITAHRLAVEDDSIGYMDPSTGLFVMTAVYLRDRGWCCDRGCRHCPYVDAEPGGKKSESEKSDE